MTIDPIWEERYRAGYGTDCPSEDVAMFLAGRKPGALLDIGCGTGANMLFAAEHDWTVYGVDGSERAIEKAKLRLAVHPHQLFCINVVDLARRDEKFDAILDIECLYSLPRDVAFRMYKKIYCMLKPGGALMVKAFTQSSWRGKEVIENARFQSINDILTMLTGFNIERLYHLERRYNEGAVKEHVVWAIK